MTPAYYRKQSSSSRDRWMVSYLDVLTILLILFVAMAAQMLHSSQTKAVAVLTPTTAPTMQRPSAELAAIKQKLEESHLDVELDPRGVVVSLPQALLFPPGEDRINSDALATVSAIGEALSQVPNNVRLVGHTDAVPIHNQRFTTNWELAAARGLRLLELLSTRYGIAESRLSVESLGSYDPKRSNDTPEGRASNRRVEIVILDSSARSKP